MKKGKIFFHPIDGSGSLAISWSIEPKGDAQEAKNGSGVGFFSNSGNLLGVIFDEVESENDKQTLEFKNFTVKIIVNKGHVEYSVIDKNSKTSHLYN